MISLILSKNLDFDSRLFKQSSSFFLNNCVSGNLKNNECCGWKNAFCTLNVCINSKYIHLKPNSTKPYKNWPFLKIKEHLIMYLYSSMLAGIDFYPISKEHYISNGSINIYKFKVRGIFT